jgi:hypothetical protein
MDSINLLEKLVCLGLLEHGDRHGKYGHRDRRTG